jgi:hypothetical protein
MTRLKVNSPAILSVGYEPDSESLQLEFPGSTIYEYHSVKPIIYMGLMHTESKGNYFDHHIKDKYEYTLVNETR